MSSVLDPTHEAAGAAFLDRGGRRIVWRYSDAKAERKIALREGARFDRSFLSRLVVKGEDRKEFLHRVTTNDIAKLSPGQGTVTLVLERTGRIIDRLLLAH